MLRSMNMTRRPRATQHQRQGKKLSLVLAVGLLLAACGGGEPTETTTGESESEATTATTAPSSSEPEATETTTATTSETTESTASGGTTVRYTQAGTSLSFANVLYAQSMGYFEDEGLTMEYLPFPPSSADVVTLLVSDQADVGFAAPSAMYAAVTQGRELKNYATAQKGPAIGITISTELADELEAEGITPDSPIEDRLAALEGHTIASVGAGTSTFSMAGAALESAGVDPNSGVTFLPVPDHDEAANSVREGQAEAHVAAMPALMTGPLDGWGVLWLTFPEVPEIGDMPWIEFTARTAFAEENPEAIEAILRALLRAGEDFKDKPDEVAAVLKENWYQDMDQGLFDAAFEVSVPTFTKGLMPTEEGLERSVAVVNAGAEVPVEVTFDEVYDTAPLEAVQP